MVKKESHNHPNMKIIFLIAAFFLILFVAIDKNPGMFTKEIEVTADVGNTPSTQGSRGGLLVTNESNPEPTTLTIKKNVSLLTYWLKK